MSEYEKTLSDAKGKHRFNGQCLSNPARKSDFWQHVLDFAAGEVCSGQATLKMRREGPSADSSQQLEWVGREVKAISETLSSVLKEVRRIQTAEKVVSDLHTRCQELSENFHEREVLQPLFCGLIGMADRCRLQIRDIHQRLVRLPSDGDERARKALRFLAKARAAHLVEVQNLLAQYGVEEFTSHSHAFDPSTQRAVARIETQDTQRINQVAERELPSYRRMGRTIRPEYVRVFVKDMSVSEQEVQR